MFDENKSKCLVNIIGQFKCGQSKYMILILWSSIIKPSSISVLQSTRRESHPIQWSCVVAMRWSVNNNCLDLDRGSNVSPDLRHDVHCNHLNLDGQRGKGMSNESPQGWTNAPVSCDSSSASSSSDLVAVSTKCVSVNINWLYAASGQGSLSVNGKFWNWSSL